MTDKAILRLDSIPTTQLTDSAPELQNALARARRAFGLANSKDGQPNRPTQLPRTGSFASALGERQPRRFAREGEVAVEFARIPPSTRPASAAPAETRQAAAEAELQAERHTRVQAQRALAEAERALRDALTQLGHARLARDEAVDSARKLKAERDDLTVKLAAERQARATAELILDLTPTRPRQNSGLGKDRATG